jgi:hypothetical protein
MKSNIQGENTQPPPSLLENIDVIKISRMKTSQMTNRYVGRPSLKMLMIGQENNRMPIANRKIQMSCLICSFLYPR